MRAKSKALVLVALGCGSMASIGAAKLMNQGDFPEVQTVAILVASTDIDYGERLNEENTRIEAWPTTKLPNGALKSLEEAEHPAGSRLVAGMPIVAKMLMPVDSPTTTIPPGYRVVTAKVTVDAAAGNLLKPGDRVDLIAFFRKSKEIPKTATRKILRNVRVFAVNADTQRVEGENSSLKTVGFLLKKDQVERTTLAIRLGELSVSLRRPDEVVDEDSESSVATIESLLGEPEVADDEPELFPQPPALKMIEETLEEALAPPVVEPKPTPSRGRIVLLKGDQSTVVETLP